jgi:hypothetical protein
MQSILAVFFILSSVLIRMLPHTPNIAPVVGIGLFAGAYLPKRWAFAVPLLAIAAGDLLIGFIPEHLFGWAAVALSVVIGSALRTNRTPLKVAGASVAGSTLFYVLSNFSVWLIGYGHMYPRTLSGLAECFIAGLPFYRNGVLGDLLYVGILFGATEFALQCHSRRLTAISVASK